MTVMLDAMMLGYSRSQRCMLQVERQIDQMVKFIKQEAEEKANEISVSAEEVHRSAVLCHFFAAKLVQHRAMSACLKQPVQKHTARSTVVVQPLLYLQIPRTKNAKLVAGVQHREAAAPRSREGQNSQGL